MSNVVDLRVEKIARMRANESKFIYIAAPYTAIEPAMQLKQLLEEAGHIVTSTWMLSGYKGDDNLSPDAWLWEAKHDALGVRRADIVVLINNAGPSTTGAMHVEYGLALGYGKGVIIVGEPTNVFHHFPKLLFAPSINDVVDRIGRLVATTSKQPQNGVE
jgi:hypothetical protein